MLYCPSDPAQLDQWIAQANLADWRHFLIRSTQLMHYAKPEQGVVQVLVDPHASGRPMKILFPDQARPRPLWPLQLMISAAIHKSNQLKVIKSVTGRDVDVVEPKIMHLKPHLWYLGQECPYSYFDVPKGALIEAALECIRWYKQAKVDGVYTSIDDEAQESKRIADMFAMHSSGEDALIHGLFNAIKVPEGTAEAYLGGYQAPGRNAPQSN
jgi:hypothetical protein